MQTDRRYHLAFSDVFFVGVTVLLGLGAVNSQNNLLFLVFGIAIGAILISGFLSGAMLLGVKVTREFTGARAVDQPLAVRYRVRNDNRLIPAFCLTIIERDPDARIDVAPVFVKHVGPGGQVVADARFRPRARGRAAFNAIEVTTRFPFGLLRKSVRFEQPDSVLIQPQTLRVKPTRLERLVSRSEVGRRAATARGSGDDFHSLREYAPGDSMRLIAWRSSARVGELLVREHTTPGTTRFIVMLDLPRNAPDDHDACERAITLAASLLHDAMARGWEVGLVVPAHGLAHRPVAEQRRLAAQLDLLAEINLEQPPHNAQIGPVMTGVLTSGAHARRLTCAVVSPTPDAATAAAPQGAVRIGVDQFDQWLRTTPPATKTSRPEAAP